MNSLRSLRITTSIRRRALAAMLDLAEGRVTVAEFQDFVKQLDALPVATQFRITDAFRTRLAELRTGPFPSHRVDEFQRRTSMVDMLKKYANDRHTALQHARARSTNRTTRADLQARDRAMNKALDAIAAATGQPTKPPHGETLGELLKRLVREQKAAPTKPPLAKLAHYGDIKPEGLEKCHDIKCTDAVCVCTTKKERNNG